MTSREDLFSGVKPVEERHRLDEVKLLAWMEKHVEGFAGPLTVQQFRGGQSNPTYRLDTPDKRYVLRRKPFGKLLPSAHAVDREYRVISELYNVGFPVARPYALCSDDSVIGAMFYVMEMVTGRIFWDGALPTLSPGERRGIYEAEIETLARLHNYDPEKIGLGDYGKPGNYFARQIERWSRQYRASETEKIEEMENLMEFLPRTVPVQERVSIVHGDYRLDNMIFDDDESKVKAVLDWELSTLGDPLADFTYFLMTWEMPSGGGAGSNGIKGLDHGALGIPTVKEAAALYCKLTGRDGIPELDWYMAYNMFRIAAILQGIAGRVRDGTAASAQALETIKRIRPLAETAWGFAKKAGA
ncbi:MAG TPA: phosphotransferase family protein [Hyphomicrobiaceae bacterium]|nr:phosphotransferase family protein [Hyphomicrobiaceae bacterium]